MGRGAPRWLFFALAACIATAAPASVAQVNVEALRKDLDRDRFSYVATVLYKTTDPRVLLSATVYVQPRVGELAWYRVLSESALDLAAGRHLGVKLSCSFRYDSRPPTKVKTIDSR